MFNAIIIHHLSDNPNVVYNIIRQHKTFEDLGTFTLARGLREIRRVQLAEEGRSRGSTGEPKNKPIDAHAERSRDEKINLIRKESQHSLDSDRPDDIEAQRQTATDDESRVGRPLNSPSAPHASVSGQQDGPSEKVRGKMRAGRSMSDDMTGSLERLAASGVGRNGFVPTEEWVRWDAMS